MVVTPGVYDIHSNVTVKGTLHIMNGARIRVRAGAKLTFDNTATVEAGDYLWAHDGAGGTFDFTRMKGWVNAQWLFGGTNNDLGVKLNKAMDFGALSIKVPPARDHRILTTVKLRHFVTIDMNFKAGWDRILVRTAGKPAFEAVGDNRHWRIIGGHFFGEKTGTPSALLQCSSGMNAKQNGGTTGLQETLVEGNWGIGIVINVSCEVLNFDRVHLYHQGFGDFVWPHTRAAVIVANADYWGLPFAYDRPNPFWRSTSSINFKGAEIGGGFPNPSNPLAPGTGATLYFKGQVEDINIEGTYLNGIGRAILLFEPGDAPTGPGQPIATGSPRRIHLTGGGRTETNKGIEWPGIPTVVVDGLNKPGHGLYHLTIGEIGHFVGGGASAQNTPLVQVINGGVAHAFNFRSSHVEGSQKLIDHRTNDLNWANVECSFECDVDATGRAIHDSTIHIRGKVLGTIGAKNLIRSQNINKVP
jgi:hypothetical protein